MNMFTQNVKPRKRGRPPGQTAQGAATKTHLYDTAMQLISKRGYEATTLRDIARKADVSVGLLYRYFPSKQAVITALHDELSADYARQATDMPAGKWRDRFVFALRTSLQVLEPHRIVLRALIPVLVGDPDDGVLPPVRRSRAAVCRKCSRWQLLDQRMRRSRLSPKRSAGFCTWFTWRCFCGGFSTRV